MRILQIDEIAVIKAGEHFMIVIDDKMYGKFHEKQLDMIVKIIKGKRGKGQ
jgi:hypothetical protein